MVEREAEDRMKKGQEQKAVDNSKRLQEVKKCLVQQKSQKP